MRLFISFLIALFFISDSCLAQTSEPTEKLKPNHEIKINLIYPLFEVLEFNYELVLENDFSVGMAANIWFLEEADVDFQFIPFFRFYPIERLRGSGFFIEANGAFMSITDEYYSYDSQAEVEENSFGGGMGVAAGYKFLSKSGFVAEMYMGIGRVFGNESVEVYPRLGITMGKRF